MITVVSLYPFNFMIIFDSNPLNSYGRFPALPFASGRRLYLGIFRLFLLGFLGSFSNDLMIRMLLSES